MLPNRPDVVAALFGVWRAGGVRAPQPRLTDDEVRHVLASVAPAALVATDDQAARLAALSGLPVVVPEEGRIAVLPPGADARPADVARHTGTTWRSCSSPPGRRAAQARAPHPTVRALMDGVVRKLRPAGGSGARRARPARRPREPMPNLIPVSLSLWAGSATCSSPWSSVHPS